MVSLFDLEYRFLRASMNSKPVLTAPPKYFINEEPLDSEQSDCYKVRYCDENVIFALWNGFTYSPVPVPLKPMYLKTSMQAACSVYLVRHVVVDAIESKVLIPFLLSQHQDDIFTAAATPESQLAYILRSIPAGSDLLRLTCDAMLA